MEANKKLNYSFGPWPMPRTRMKDFIAVTEANRKMAVVIGRIFYIIEKTGKTFLFRGSFSIDPCFTKGEVHYPFKPWIRSNETHYKIIMPDNLDYNKWATDNKALIDKYIAENTLYLNPSDPILTYKQ